MIPLFLGLSIANLILLATVFGLGLFATDAQHKTTGVYSYHISLAFASGMMRSSPYPPCAVSPWILY